MPLPGAGGGKFLPDKGGMVIKLFLHGHANRPFYHIGITSHRVAIKGPRAPHLVEQLGSYDPMPNKDNQKLIALNVERTRYWMGKGATFTKNLAMLLGQAGFLPIHPETVQHNWRYRHKVAAEEAKKKAEAEIAQTSQPPSSSSTS